MRRIIPICLLASACCFGAISANTVWEVRTTGNDLDGGGFVAGAVGTDYSRQDAAQYTFADLASTVGTTDPCVVTSTSHNFDAADVGNLLHVSAGTNWTAGWYQIASVAANAATLDRACGSAATLSGGTYYVGGALATIGQLATNMVTSNAAWIKAGTGYTQTATSTFAGSVVPGQQNALFGYTATRGDGGMATLTLSTNTGLTGLASSGNGWRVENITVNCSSLGTSTGFAFTGSYGSLFNVAARNCKSNGINAAGSIVAQSEVSGGGGTGISAEHVIDSYIHDSTETMTGIALGGGGAAVDNIVANLSGTSTGILTNISNILRNNTIYSIGGPCINAFVSFTIATYVKNNLLERCGAGGSSYGITATQAVPAQPLTDGNAFLQWYALTNRNNMDSTTGIYAAEAYMNSHDRIGSAEFFNSPASGIFSLNNSSGGGHEARGYATPAALPGTSGFSSYADFGAAQHWANPLASAGAAVHITPFVDQSVPAPVFTWTVEGDSITGGSGTMSGVQTYAADTRNALTTYAVYSNVATAGKTCGQMVSEYASQVAPTFNASSTYNIASLMCGTNPESGGLASSAYTQIQAWVAAAKATGFTVVVGLIPDKSSGDTYVHALNGLITAGAVAGGYTAFGSDNTAPMYCSGCSMDTMYFQDGVHPTVLGATFIAAYLTGAMNAIGIN